MKARLAEQDARRDVRLGQQAQSRQRAVGIAPPVAAEQGDSQVDHEDP